MKNFLTKDFSDNALKSINEVADELQVESYILRFWEGKFPQIKPIKGNGNRRLYSESDINILKQIKDLLYDQGFTIEGAKKFLKNKQAGEVITLNTNQKSVSEVILELKQIKSELEDLI